MKIENSVIVKASLELAKEYKETHSNATYEEWLMDLQWNKSTVEVMERYLKEDSLKDYLGIDGYIKMIGVVDTYREGVIDPTDFDITLNQWLSVKIEGLLYDDDYYFDIEGYIDITKMGRLLTLNN